MSKRVVSDSTGLYRLNIVNKERNNQDENTTEQKINGNERDTEESSPSKAGQPPSPRRTALKIDLSNTESNDQDTEKEIMTKIAKVEDEILQCESKLVSLNQELKALQQKLRPVINQNVVDERSDNTSLLSASPEKSLLGSPNSTWKLFKENGSNLLKKFKDFTINDEQEQEYDDYLAKNRNNGIHHFTVKNGLNYEYDTESEPDQDSNDSDHI
ncbi:Acf4 [Kluyveromyces lactis]|nr:Acf4 [Kluyveromyces lactis]